MMLLEKNMYEKLVTKVNAIDTSRFILKTQHNTDNFCPEKKIIDADYKILDISGLSKNTDYDVKITEIEGKIPSITGLVTAAALTVH